MRLTHAQLRQSDVWPSESKGKDIPIWDMDPRHAFNAWRKLRDDAANEGMWLTVRLSPLAQRLLHQAMDEEVVYSDTLPESPLFAELDSPEDTLLERCFDGLSAIDALTKAHDGPLHPIRRAQVMARYINPKENL